MEGSLLREGSSFKPGKMASSTCSIMSYFHQPMLLLLGVEGLSISMFLAIFRERPFQFSLLVGAFKNGPLTC
jgi:hypothetical protein